LKFENHDIFCKIDFGQAVGIRDNNLDIEVLISLLREKGRSSRFYTCKLDFTPV